MVDKKPVQTSQGISKTIGDIYTAVAREPNRNLQNLYQSVGNFFASKPQAKAGQGAGDRAYPDLVRKATPKKTSGKKTSGGAGQQAYVDEYMAMLDAMRGAGGGGGGGGGRGPAYSAAQIAEAQAGMSANRAKMEALYKRYADDITAREADIAANYGTAATNLGSIYDTATGNINKSYEQARAAQNAQLLALGMTEQTPVQSFGNQTGATTSLENLKAAVLAQNEATRKAAITNQRLAAEGATREGTQKLSAYDAQMAKAIADMQNATVSYGGGGGGSSSGGLNANQYASLVLQKMKMDQDAAIAANKAAGSGVSYSSAYQEAIKAGRNATEADAYARGKSARG